MAERVLQRGAYAILLGSHLLQLDEGGLGGLEVLEELLSELTGLLLKLPTPGQGELLPSPLHGLFTRRDDVAEGRELLLKILGLCTRLSALLAELADARTLAARVLLADFVGEALLLHLEALYLSFQLRERALGLLEPRLGLFKLLLGRRDPLLRARRRGGAHSSASATRSRSARSPFSRE